MFNDLLSYSGIVTKTKAMQAKLITEKEYEDISSLSSVSDFISFLKAQPAYQNLFANSDEKLLHRNEIEHILMNSLYLDYAKIFRFAGIKQRKALDLLFFRYEVNILKACLQNVFTDEDSYDLSVFEPFFKKHSKLNIRTLSSCISIEEFISNLKNTKFYDLFQKIQTTNATLYDFEVQLDIFYFTSVWKRRKEFAKSHDLEAITDIIGKKIDFLNIMSIYRAKKFYQIDQSQIYSFIIPIHYRMSSNQLMSLIEANTKEEFVSLLSSTRYHEDDTSSTNKNNSIETLYERNLITLYRDSQKKYPFSMCTIFKFLFMKELEIDRLTTALECIRYGLDSSLALNYILK
ncbi:MAG: V/A-type H+/Na+-transporting ATPase subunit [Clostridiales bacterium]|nr:V/A-type H+/Na+-transporting ATPase subunit [Clostridiales bacterium]